MLDLNNHYVAAYNDERTYFWAQPNRRRRISWTVCGEEKLSTTLWVRISRGRRTGWITQISGERPIEVYRHTFRMFEKRGSRGRAVGWWFVAKFKVDTPLFCTLAATDSNYSPRVCVTYYYLIYYYADSRCKSNQTCATVATNYRYESGRWTSMKTVDGDTKSYW